MTVDIALIEDILLNFSLFSPQPEQCTHGGEGQSAQMMQVSFIKVYFIYSLLCDETREPTISLLKRVPPFPMFWFALTMLALHSLLFCLVEKKEMHLFLYI